MTDYFNERPTENGAGSDEHGSNDKTNHTEASPGQKCSQSASLLAKSRTYITFHGGLISRLTGHIPCR
jgi:hypothetical protein